MPKTVFSKEVVMYHAIGLAFREHGIKIGMIEIAPNKSVNSIWRVDNIEALKGSLVTSKKY